MTLNVALSPSVQSTVTKAVRVATVYLRIDTEWINAPGLGIEILLENVEKRLLPYIQRVNRCLEPDCLAKRFMARFGYSAQSLQPGDLGTRHLDHRLDRCLFTSSFDTSNTDRIYHLLTKALPRHHLTGVRSGLFYSARAWSVLTPVFIVS